MIKADAEQTTRNESETEEAGYRLGKRLRGGEVITLSGPLGAGKTSLTRGIGKALDLPVTEISSPTFILRAEHDAKYPLAHVDLYRIDTAEEIMRLGLFEQEDPKTVLVIEWPERGGTFLPPNRLEIEIVPEGGSLRRLRLTARGAEFGYLTGTPD